MSDGSAVVITVAKMITANGESFDGTGLSVDIEVAPSSNTESGAPLESDPQVSRALAAAKLLTGSSTDSGESSSSAASDSASASSADSAAEDTSSSASTGEE